MTESSTPTVLQPTRLAGLLEKEGTTGMCAYAGMLTPRLLDAPETEIAALLGAAAVHDLGWLTRVAVRGADRFRWLSGMVTNMVKDLASGSGAWNLVLNAQGRIQGDLTVWREGDELEIELASDQREKLLAHLDHFIIMDDVELAPVEGVTALGIAGPRAAQVLESLGLPVPAEAMSSARAKKNDGEVMVRRAYGVLVPHYQLWIPEADLSEWWRALLAAGAVAAGAEALEAVRIAEGVPVYGVDIAERDLPQETSQMRALHFTKGCYLGQEIVERIRSRGNVHRHLRLLELAGPLPAAGTELTTEDGAPAGHITSAAALSLAGSQRLFALGMIRGEAEVRNQPLKYLSGAAAGTARLLSAPPTLPIGQ